jgi:hypothetical protein
MFVLSKLTAGEAELWRRMYMQGKDFEKPIAYKGCWEELENVFKKENEADQALLDLHNLRQGAGDSAETTITHFQNLIALAKVLTEGNNRVFIDYLRNALNKRLVERVSLMIDEPTTFEKWVDFLFFGWHLAPLTKREGAGRQAQCELLQPAR